MEKGNLEIVKSLVIDILKKINKIISNDCKDNFLNNSKNIGIIFDSKLLDEYRNKVTHCGTTSMYSIKDNRIYFDKSALKKIKDNDEIFIYQLYNDLIHELLHMASSNYDSVNNVFRSGFDEEPFIKDNHTNCGITEGMTEVLRKLIYSEANIEKSDYYVITLITYQLIELIGLITIAKSYFKNLGTENLKNKLNIIKNDNALSEVLFEQIENYFYSRNKSEGASILGYVQRVLVEYFIQKCNIDLNSGVSYEEVINNTKNFERYLVTEDVLESMGKDSSEYQNLSEALAQFYIFKESILDKEIAI